MNKNIIVLCFALVFMHACTSKTDQSTSYKQEKKAEDIQYCFENIFPYQDSSGLADRETLKLVITGENVVGEFNWLPAEKDSRIGTLKGKINQNEITAVYKFMQEGLTESTEITILLLEGKAEIKNDKPELGIKTTIKQIECN